MKEEWRDAVGYEGCYQVSNKGNLKSLKRRYMRSNGRVLNTSEKILKQSSVNSYGHLGVSLYMDGKRKTELTHRLVLEAFDGPCQKGMECCHGKGGMLDNSLSNLRWGTRSDQWFDRFRDGTHLQGELQKNSKLTESDVMQIRNMLNDGVYQKEIALKFGVSQAQISKIKLGKKWKWLKKEVKDVV